MNGSKLKVEPDAPEDPTMRWIGTEQAINHHRKVDTRSPPNISTQVIFTFVSNILTRVNRKAT